MGCLGSVVPWSAIDAVRDSLADSGASTGKKPASEEWRSRLSQRVEEAPVELVAQLPKTQLSLQRVANLKKGDVIPLVSAEDVLLCVVGQALLKGHFGSHQGQLAVQITGSASAKKPMQEG